MNKFHFNLAILDLDAVRAELELVVGGLAPADFPSYVGGVGAVAEDAEAKYKGYLLGDAIPGRGVVKNPHPGTAKGVYRRNDGLLLWALGSVAAQAEDLEDGAPRRDMKIGIAHMNKARRAKDGHSYLIIPFRHNIPAPGNSQAMPRVAYNQAKTLSPSKALGVVGLRPNAKGGEVDKYGYLWGGRLTSKGLQAGGATPHQIKRYAGMVRFSTTTPGSKVQSSSYMTFRVMSERSRPESWWYPAIEALHPLEEAINQAFLSGRPDLEQALRKDLGQL